jgi:hypothetical protein
MREVLEIHLQYHLLKETMVVMVGMLKFLIQMEGEVVELEQWDLILLLL